MQETLYPLATEPAGLLLGWERGEEKVPWNKRGRGKAWSLSAEGDVLLACKTCLGCHCCPLEKGKIKQGGWIFWERNSLSYNLLGKKKKKKTNT